MLCLVLKFSVNQRLLYHAEKRKRDVKSKTKKHDLIGKLLLNDIEKGFGKR